MAGLLGEIFSAGNVAKRKLTDLLGNPLLSAQQFVGNINDKARNLNELTAAAAQEGVNYGPASQQLGGLLAEGYNPAGITAYHAGPNLFSKFDVKRAPDTGSAYTQGAYAAAARREAEGKYLPRAPQWEEKLMGLYKQAEKSKDYESMEVLESALLYKNPKQLRQDFIESGEYSPEFAKKAEQTIKKIESVPRDSYLYKLDIADEALKLWNSFKGWLSPRSDQSSAKERKPNFDNVKSGSSQFNPNWLVPKVKESPYKREGGWQ